VAVTEDQPAPGDSDSPPEDPEDFMYWWLDNGPVLRDLKHRPAWWDKEGPGFSRLRRLYSRGFRLE
jgi:hypothetical protein